MTRYLLLTLFAGCASTNADDAEDIDRMTAVTSRCENLHRDGSFARDVIGHSDVGLDDPIVWLTGNGSGYIGEPDDVYLLADPEQDGEDVSVVYVGRCPDDFRVTIFFW